MNALEVILDKLAAISLDVAVWALVVTLIIAVLNARRAARIEKEENYIQLELASNDLFRFEAANAEKIEPFLETTKPSEVPTSESTIRSFLFQTLNLFEIAVRLRRDDRFGKQAFGTWVIWFYDTCDGWYFRQQWPELRENYTAELRDIFDQMVTDFDPNENPEISKELFFTHVAERLNCPIVKNWRQESKPTKKITTSSNPTNTTTTQDIRLATAEDNQSIATLISDSIQKQSSYLSHGDYFVGRSVDGKHFVPNLHEAIIKELKDPDSNIQYALAYSNSESLIGCAAFYIENNGHQNYCVLDDIVVSTHARSQGIGAKLYDYVVQHANQSGSKKVLLESGAKNHTAHQFFEARGFKVMSKTFYKDL